jgi:hypothetical protein
MFSFYYCLFYSLLFGIRRVILVERIEKAAGILENCFSSFSIAFPPPLFSFHFPRFVVRPQPAPHQPVSINRPMTTRGWLDEKHAKKVKRALY